MRRALVVFFALCLIVWLEFAYFPGHTYLGSASQVYIAALEHLQQPGFLSRDLAAAHPNFGLTAYDELTLLLAHVTHLGIERVLAIEHFLSRAAGLFGLFLLARSLGLKIWHSAAVASVLNLGTYLGGAEIWLFGPEPVPRVLATGPLVLAFGLLARGQILLGGFLAGCALLLDPAFAAPFWLVLIIEFVTDRRFRTQLRPLVPVLLVFVLLLANLSQLQQGTPDAPISFSALPAAIARIDQYRSPELWVSLWPSKWIYFYLAAFTIFVWGLTRLWPALNRQMRWLFLLLASIGVLTIPASAILVDRLRSQAVLSAEIMHQLAILVLFTLLVCAAAAVHAGHGRRWREAGCWAAAAVLIFLPSPGKQYRESSGPHIAPLAEWARVNTWGSSMFLFPEEGRSGTAGRFRAESLRALWVDWSGGAEISHDPALAPEWFRRWQSTMEQPLTAEHLQSMLALPIDYFVLRRDKEIEARTNHETRQSQPVFEDAHFAVYEASTLRIVPGRLVVDRR